MNVLWFFPTGGDERFLGTPVGRRAATFNYLKQIATALDSLGYDGALLPTGTGCEEAWVTATALMAVTQRLKFLIAVRPAVMTPAQAARMASTFDRLSGGRLLINVVTGSGKEGYASEGIPINYEQRYAVTDEFLTIWRALMQDGKADFDGEHLTIHGGTNPFAPVQKPYPPLWFGGSSEEGIRVGAKHADVYLTWGEPPAMAAEKIAQVKKEAANFGRMVQFGIRLHVVVRETESEAWDAANDLIKSLDAETIAKAQQTMQSRDSEGQRRMMALHNGSRDNLIVSPNLWAGLGLVRAGAGTALVGSPQQIADRMQEYASLGIETFILSGYPHLEEAYTFAELVFPLLSLSHAAQIASPAAVSQSAFLANHAASRS